MTGDFEAFARDHGLILDYAIADDRVHRVPTEGHPRKRNGAYQFNGQTGWVQAWDEHLEAIPFRHRYATAKPLRIASERPRIDRKAQEAAEHEAREIIARSAFQPHPYLSRKGFPRESGLVDANDGRLVIPMYDARRYPTLRSVQRIAADGSKLFLRGGAAKDAVFHLGRGMVDVLVEGFVTALSVRAATESMYIKARVVVAFSAGNLANVARLYPRAVVVADNDASQAGEVAARKTGLRWVMPPTVGDDANDLHQRDGLSAVCRLLRDVLT